MLGAVVVALLLLAVIAGAAFVAAIRVGDIKGALKDLLSLSVRQTEAQERTAAGLDKILAAAAGAQASSGATLALLRPARDSYDQERKSNPGGRSRPGWGGPDDTASGRSL